MHKTRTGDYHRTYKFNPTLGIGKHKQIVEIECQREYEGKGAYPNYIADGVLNGFEELKSDSQPYCFEPVKIKSQFCWYLDMVKRRRLERSLYQNELWCDINVAILANWAKPDVVTGKGIV